ncbi:MAG TPA: 16S rRNA (cytidine(1402)-2'-O)-methyltransferase, partial [Sphingomonadales bacterium]|nr:16S rRNA (cytidine(1402)-2'-O)-methyltransferase [Sphingomonadales bacterium]
KSGLYVAATPIGNLSDFSPRAKAVLEAADAILCEDTRVTKKLLSAFGISKPLLTLHEHNEDKAVPGLIKRLQGGETLALVSDAGTPLISDPGFLLVRAAQEAGIPVIPIPGPSAAVAALMASGLAPDKFLFAGFLPAKDGQRQKALEDLKAIPATLIFYESPNRVVKTLGTMVRVFGPAREAAMARELTKLHEEIIRKPLAELLDTLKERDSIKGEVVLLVGRGQEGEAPVDDAALEGVLKNLLKTMSVNDAAAALSKLTGKPKKDIYRRALDLKK